MRSIMTSFTVLLLLSTPLVMADEPIISPEAGLPVIDWKDAGNYIDQEVIVQGRIVEAANIGKMAFLNFDSARSFTAIVQKRNFTNFPKSVEFLYAGKRVRIRGVISEYKGRQEIELSRPDQITVLAKLEQILPTSPAQPREFSGVVTLACYNVLNLFDEYDDPYHSDEGTPPKSKKQLEKLAQTIRKMDADVIALEEVENRDYLQRFVRAMLPDMGYREVVCYEGNDRRGIDCAVLSRFPVGPVTSYRHLRFSDDSGGTMRFRRDLIQVRIEPPAYPSFDVFVVHLKSKRGGSSTERIRIAETRAVRKILDGILHKDANARFVICGDFNDTWDSPPLKIIRGEGKAALNSFFQDLPKKTPTFNKEPFLNMIDFHVCSPAMAARYVPKSYRVITGSVASSGSDHNPVLIQFDLKTQ